LSKIHKTLPIIIWIGGEKLILLGKNLFIVKSSTCEKEGKEIYRMQVKEGKKNR
jgi:hypothetical protein